MYVVLIICIFLLLLFALHIFNNEVMCPPVIVLVMFLMSSTLGLLRFDDWELETYGGVSVALLLLALVAFIFGSLIGAGFVKNTVQKNTVQPIRHDRIDLPGIPLFFIMVLMLATNVLFYYTVSDAVISLGFSHGSLSEVINNFRLISAFYQDRYALPTYVKLLSFCCTCIGTISVFVLVHNLAFRKKKATDFYYLLCIILWVTVLLLLSNRSGILFVLSEAIYFFYFFWNIYYGWNQQVNIKVLKWGVRIFVVFMIGFIALAVGLGRFGSVSEMNLLDYVTVYISSGVRNFDLFIKDPPISQGLGTETFPSVYRTLIYRFGLGSDTNINAWLEFKYINGLRISNIYTCFRRYYADFGIGGMTFLSFLMGFWFTMSYKKIKRYCYKNIITFRMLVFVYLSRALFYMPIDDTLFEFEFSLNGVFKLFVLYILFRIFIYPRVLRCTTNRLRLSVGENRSNE